MSEISLCDLGFTKEELEEKLLTKLADQILNSVGFENYEEDFDGKSQFARNIEKRLKAKIEADINTAIASIGEKYILPGISQYLENMVIETTNNYGEKKGEPKTFIEYLAERAQRYITEQVDSDGETQDEKRARGNSWYGGKQTRIAYMMNKHLQYSINTAMKNALGKFNASIAEGLTETVRLQLAALQIQFGIKLEVVEKR